MHVARGILCIAALIAVAWLLSSNRRRFPWRIVIGGLALQWAFALLVLKTDPGSAFFDGLSRVVMAVLTGADAGASFVFGPLAGGHPDVAWHAIAGIKILTTIIIVATISSIGYHYGVLQRLVRVMALALTRVLGVSGPESLAGAANVFFGQTEAPLLVKPYISGMTRSELMALMTGGFATAAAGVMAVYVKMLGGDDLALTMQAARHLMTASLMSAPAAFVMAKVMMPPDPNEPVSDQVDLKQKRETQNLLDAATQGASQGMSLAINVLAMLIAFVAAIKIIDVALIALGNTSLVAPIVESMGLHQLDLDGLTGLAFSPIAWLMGVDGSAGGNDPRTVGALLGKAMMTNELIAYDQLGDLVRANGLSPRSITIATFSLCGFANISSIGIQIGGIGAIAPDRRSDLIKLGPRAMLGGAMACWMTGTIAGLLVE